MLLLLLDRESVMTSSTSVLLLSMWFLSNGLLMLFIIVSRSCSRAANPPPKSSHPKQSTRSALKSVNWHFTRVCNYKCEFCYHVNTNSFVVSIPDGCRALERLAAAGTKKINFSGGEPFLYPKQLGAWCSKAKELGMYVSIISNGSKATEAWLEQHHRCVDMIGVSVDSCTDETHEMLGRWDPRSPMGHIAHARQLGAWCRAFSIEFKVNTVVTRSNMLDDMTELIEQLQPSRWKIFQLLLIEGENVQSKLRDAKPLAVSTEEFQAFVARHEKTHKRLMKVEDNATMRNSYVILDERLRFLNNANGSKEPSRHTILEVGVERAFENIHFEEDAFKRRDGEFFEDMEDIA